MKLPPVTIVAAMTPNRVIGDNGAMPWRIPSDMRHFRRLTMHPHSAVVMGPKTYRSIGRPLPGRLNIVLTTKASWEAPGVQVAHTPREALELAAIGDQREFYAIGGMTIYETFIPLAEQMFITHVWSEARGDTFFPHFNESEWYEVLQRNKWRHRAGDPVPTRLVHYKRIVR